MADARADLHWVPADQAIAGAWIDEAIGCRDRDVANRARAASFKSL